MTKISNSEINALIRKLEAEIKPTEKKLEEFEKNWKPTEDELLLINILKEKEPIQNQLNNLQVLYVNECKRIRGEHVYGTIESVEQRFKQEAKSRLSKRINIQALKDDLLLSGLSSNFNLEEWLKEAKTKYVK